MKPHLQPPGSKGSLTAPAVGDRQFWIYEQGVIDIPTNQGANPGSIRPTPT